MHIPRFVRDRFLPFLMLLVCLATVLAVATSGISSIVHRHKAQAEFDAIEAERDRRHAREADFLIALAKGNAEKSNELIQSTDKLIRDMDLVLKKDGK